MTKKKELLPLCPMCKTPLEECERETGRMENTYDYMALVCPNRNCNYEWSGL